MPAPAISPRIGPKLARGRVRREREPAGDRGRGLCVLREDKSGSNWQRGTQFSASIFFFVMPGLVPGIRVFVSGVKKDVDARHKPA